ncbi:MAG: hypothetical protein JWR10_1190, partial [Rubritepida sp.]|nr:hypothetical protein [Rubritepida sp.]
DKEARRAAALRLNLRKRKAQTRARAETTGQPGTPTDGRAPLEEARPTDPVGNQPMGERKDP